MMNEIDFMRRLEQDIQHLHERVRNGYSGVPEAIAIKRVINERMIELLEAQSREQVTATSERL